MKIAGRGLILLFLLGLPLGFSNGCKPAPPCLTSLISLDETRLDAEIYEREAQETGRKVDDLESRSTKKEEEIDKLKDQPARLEKRLHELKKGSGRE